MAELTVLRVEVSNVGEVDESSLNSKNKSTNKSLVAGGLAGASLANATLKSHYGITFPEEEMNSIGRLNTREYRKEYRRDRLSLMLRGKSLNGSRVEPWKQFGKNIDLPSMQNIKNVSGIIGGAAAVYSVYSNYQQVGYQLSGATHAAAVQGRKSSMITGAATLGITAAVNPAIAVGLIAMKAWQTAQANRKEIFEIRKNQMTSEVLQRNLIKNVAERRF